MNKDDNVLYLKDEEVMDSRIDISTYNEQIVTIEADGTVVIHKEGGDKEAAKLFYEALEIEGKTLHAKIEELTKENEELKQKVCNCKK